jgi:release factor glutamine methyltransferase
METADIVAGLRAAGCVFAEDEARILVRTARSGDELLAMIEQRTMGLPLEHIVGWTEFCGMRIRVSSRVFVPRPRSELLVREAAAIIALYRETPAIVDMCCGSGAVGGVLLHRFEHIEVHAVDVDPGAVQCARRNITRGCVYEGDLYQALPVELRGRVDVVVANPPYVPTEEIAMMPPEARLHEPHIALDGGPDGLRIQHAIVEGAVHWLRAGGSLLIETSARQAARTLEMFEAAGFDARIVSCDELGATIVTGTFRGRCAALASS